MNVNQTKDYIRRVDIIKLIISELAELETIYINKKDEPLDERYGINTPMDKILLGRANLGGCLKELVKNDQLQWFKSDYPDLWAKIPEQIKREIDVDSKPTPDAKPEAEKKTTANNKNPVKRISIPKLLDSLKDDPNKELTPNDTARLNDRKSSSQISNWLRKNYDKKLLQAFDRMTDQNHNTKQTYSTAIESVFKTINPFLSEIIDRSLKNKLKQSRLCVGKDGFVRDIKGK